ncbi:hypothetical protein [Solitalea lacus]|uniref:hypothetical protein n=1 Tax=Solitalea lacus TaxID=2911172 RepID=UPI001EDB83B5|nr:hypothetical protein [Solitalea lacus]UKJ08772.1 hypothetical protein L2B55_06300 [Solitalea lacus]
MNHIAYCIQWMDVDYLKSVEVGWEPPALKNKKSDVIKLLVKAYADVEKTVSGFD